MARNKVPMDERTRILRAAFRMPSVQTMVSRKSSITNAFVNAILPMAVPTVDEIEQALTILKMEPTQLRCSYCAEAYTEWDHLRPIVEKMRPTGYISEIANLVPSCGKCNQSKGNAYWRTWMLSKADRSPMARAIANVDELVARLEAFERWKTPTKIDFERLLGPEKWRDYWQMWDAINTELRSCQDYADALRAEITQKLAL